MRESWETRKLGDLLTQVSTRQGSSTHEPLILSVTKHRGIVPAQEFFNNRVASRTVENYKVVEPGDFAYSTIHIDEGAIARSKQPRGIVSPMYTVMRVSADSIHPAFAEHLLQSPRLLREYTARAAGSINRRRSLPFAKFAEIEIALPPIDEQIRIADLLSSLDRESEAVAAELRALERWYEASLELKLEAVRRRALLGELATSFENGISPRCLERPPFAGEVGVLKVSSVAPRHFDETLVKTLPSDIAPEMAKQVRAGDLLVTRASGSIRRVGVAAFVSKEPAEKLLLSDLVFRVRVDQSRLLPAFASLVLGTREVRRQIEQRAVGSSTMKKVNLTILKSLEIRLPELGRQIVLTEDFAAYSSLRLAKSKQVETLESLRRALVSALLSGSHELPSAYDRSITEDSSDLQPDTAVA